AQERDRTGGRPGRCGGDDRPSSSLPEDALRRGTPHGGGHDRRAAYSAPSLRGADDPAGAAPARREPHPNGAGSWHLAARPSKEDREVRAPRACGLDVRGRETRTKLAALTSRPGTSGSKQAAVTEAATGS